MRFLAAALILVICIGCEKKPTPEEIQEKREAERVARPSPSPKFQDKLKNYKSPLER
jgi:hypothetical protein